MDDSEGFLETVASFGNVDRRVLEYAETGKFRSPGFELEYISLYGSKELAPAAEYPSRSNGF